MPGITTAFAQGLAANRPAASSANSGYYWLSTDTAGGTLYQSNGSAWVQVAGSVNAGAGTFTGEVSAGDFKAIGLTGATAASRYVGAVASGAPAAGTFAVGDFTIDQTGFVWVCTTAGTPGTWTKVGGGSTSVTTKGDVQGYSTVAARIPVGSDSQVLIADSTQTLGVRWGASPAGAGGALTQLAQQVLGSSAANITFSSISGSYSNLLVVLVGRSDQAATNTQVKAQINADTGSNYDNQEMYNNSGGSGSGGNFAAQASGGCGYVSGATAPANAASGTQATFFDYARTQWQKSWSYVGNVWGGTTTGSNYMMTGSSFWRSTAAITSIKLFPASGNFVTGTVATLYGVS